jgi:excisionase family DNA binding protein
MKKTLASEALVIDDAFINKIILKIKEQSPQSKNRDEIYSVKQVGQILGIGGATILKYISNGQLPSVKIGKAYKIKSTDLETFIKQKYND